MHKLEEQHELHTVKQKLLHTWLRVDQYRDGDMGYKKGHNYYVKRPLGQGQHI